MKDKDYKNQIDSLPEIIFELDLDLNITYINNAGKKILQIDDSNAPNTNYPNLVYSDDRESILVKIESLYNGTEHISTECRLEAQKDHKIIPSLISANAIRENGTVIGIRGMAINITGRKQVEDNLRRDIHRLRKLSDLSFEGIIFHDMGVIIDANKAISKLFGYEFDELIGTNIIDYVLPKYKKKLEECINSLESEIPFEIKALKKNGSILDIEMRSVFFVLDNKITYALIIQDVSLIKQLEYAQDHDELTGLLNKRGFKKHLTDEFQRAKSRDKKIALMTIRLDQEQIMFIKHLDIDLESILINAIPIEISERLLESFFETDIIARTDENEYMSIHQISKKNGADEAVKLINKIMKVFSENFVKGIRLVPHIGVSFYPDDLDSHNPNRLIKNSNYACEEAIRDHVEYTFYNENSHRETRERIEFEKDLIFAVREDKCKDFILYYQPKVNKRKQIVGLEALIRWKHPRWNNPKTGLVAPNRFIKTAEDIGLISEIGDWVIKEACHQLKKWQTINDCLKHLQVAVNVSPSQLNEDLVLKIDAIINSTGIKPEKLEIEITERETIKEKNIPILEKLQSKNISIAIDDFGIEHSALSKLPKLSIDTIKLDKSYIDDISHDSDYENLVKYTIDMVHSLKYSVVAEGVEEKSQAEKLFSDMNCDKIQGYYFYKPLSPEDCEKAIKDNLINFSNEDDMEN